MRNGIVREFNFNRFSLRLDFQSRTVQLDDELDTSLTRFCTLSLDDFAKSLRAL